MLKVGLKQREESHSHKMKEAQAKFDAEVKVLKEENARLKKKVEDGVNSSSLTRIYVTKEKEFQKEIRELKLKVMISFNSLYSFHKSTFFSKDRRPGIQAQSRTTACERQLPRQHPPAPGAQGSACVSRGV